MSIVPSGAIIKIEVEIKSQVAVVIVETAAAQRDKPCPGNPYNVVPV
jgi:hypothetical protein